MPIKVLSFEAYRVAAWRNGVPEENSASTFRTEEKTRHFSSLEMQAGGSPETAMLL
jgi:hypothetical protein